MSSIAAPRVLLRNMFDAAIASAQPALCVPPHLPEPPRGRLIVVGAGKASAAMARAVEENWAGPLWGLVVTRYGYADLLPRRRSDLTGHAQPARPVGEHPARHPGLLCGGGRRRRGVIAPYCTRPCTALLQSG